MKYLVVDTNIWVRIISQGKPGCEITHFDDLRRMIEAAKIILLLPEVIQLELEKNWRSFKESVEIEIGKVEKELNSLLKKPFWTEIEDVQTSLQTFLAEQKQKKVTEATERYREVQNLLSSPQIVVLPFTPDINFRGRRRLMAGRMPEPKNQAHSDACIIESLAKFFLEHGPNDQHELYFCSENVRDFGLTSKDRHIFHPLHQEDLSAATEYCISLNKVIALIQSDQKAIPPSPDVIKEALAQRTEDEVVAEIDLEEERKPSDMCAELNCFAPRHIISRYCPAHYALRLGNLTHEQREAHDEKLNRVLMTLTYREREIIKLRWALQDGYTYTAAECGRIFKVTPQSIGQITALAIRKLQQPARKRVLDKVLP